MNWTGFIAFVVSVSIIAGLVVLVVVGTRSEEELETESWMIKGHRRKL